MGFPHTLFLTVITILSLYRQSQGPAEWQGPVLFYMRRERGRIATASVRTGFAMTGFCKGCSGRRELLFCISCKFYWKYGFGFAILSLIVGKIFYQSENKQE